MTNEEFLSEFGHIAEAPDGTVRLRRLILDLAVRGRLVPQDPDDEPASVLLERIAEEREQLVEEKKIRKARKQASVELGHDAFAIPASWAWAPLGGLGEWSGGGTPSKSNTSYWTDGDVPWISPKDMKSFRIEASQDRITRLAAAETSARLRPAQTVAMVVRSGILSHTFPVSLIPIEASFNQDMKVISPLGEISPTWLTWALRGEGQRILFRCVKQGTTVESIDYDRLLGFRLAIPPPAEQQRIVARVDELMTLCDELEEGQAKATELRAATARSTLVNIVESDRADTEHAVELINNHVRLALSPGTGAAEVVAELRKAILDLAVRGRLVPQDPADEPASVLLERIAEERERLVKGKKVKKGKSLPDVDPEKVPYRVPESWQWSRIGTLVGLGIRGSSAPALLGREQWVLDLEDVEKHSGSLVQRVTSADRPTTSSKTNFAERDVLYGKLRPYLNKVVVADSCGCCTTEMLVLTPLGGMVSEFVALSLRCPAFVEWATNATHGVKMPRLGSTLLRTREIGVPPLSEQQRIVARVDELMALCDELGAGLLAERRVAGEFSESAMAALVAQAA